jgi:hypothetical protein
LRRTPRIDHTTIALALAVPDGIAFAADTQTTWNQTITSAKEKGTDREVELAAPIVIPVGASRLSRKLFSLSIGGATYGVAVSGTALIDNKTPYSILRSLEKAYRGDNSYDEVLAFLIEGLKADLSVSDLLEASQFLPITLILGGYEGGAISKPILRVVFIYSGKPQWAIAGESAQSRLVKRGNDRGLQHLLDRSRRVRGAHRLPQQSRTPGNVWQLFAVHSVRRLNYVRFLAENTCDFQRFATMVPDCGRPVLTATLTPEGFVEAGAASVSST